MAGYLIARWKIVGHNKIVGMGNDVIVFKNTKTCQYSNGTLAPTVKQCGAPCSTWEEV